jgi:hypothetical protein
MKDFFQQLNLLFLILLSGQVFFCLVVILLNSGPEYVAQQRDSELFDTLLPIFILSMTFAVHLIDKQRLKRGVLLKTLQEKLRFYRRSVFLRLMLMEATNIFAIVIALVEGKLHYSVYFLIGLMAFIYFRPSMPRFMEEYNET